MLTSTIVFILLIIIDNSLIVNSQSLTLSSLELKLVTIVHRHGDRAPLFFLPGDPYGNETFWPDGRSQLLSTGKNRLFQFGRSLRSYYDQFLTNSPREVYSYSSDADRCIESTNLLLHGLYQASGRWRYNIQTNYLPIPVHTTPKFYDRMLAEGVNCPTLDKELSAVFEQPEAKSFQTRYSKTLDLLSSKLGFPVNDLGIILGLYDVWSIEQSVNYTLPKWLTPFIMNDLKSMVDLYATIQNNSPIIHRLRAGTFFQNLKNHLLLKINTQWDNQLKLITYSTHDTMLGAFMSALKIFNERRVPYGASLLIELLKNPVNHGDHYVRIKFWNETYTNHQHVLSMPFCSAQQLCPLDQFIDYMDQFIPTNWEIECGFGQSNLNNQPIGPSQQSMDYKEKAWKVIGIITVTCLTLITLIICVLFISFLYNLYKKSNHFNRGLFNRSDREKQEYDRIL